jgi:DNA polymerase I-like protein with 3'-5' exonuclease and polymerase domains
VNDTTGIEEFDVAVAKASIVGLDVETSGLDLFNDTWLLLQVSIGEDVYVFDIVGLSNEMHTVVQSIVNSGTLCVGHNIKFDMKCMFINTKIKVETVFDTMIGDGVVYTGLGRPFVSLKAVLEKYLNIIMEKDVRDDFIDATVVTQEMLIYAAKDTVHLVPLYEKIMEALLEENLVKVADLEMELLPAVAWMEVEGCGINTVLWEELTKNAVARQKVWEEKLKNSLIEPTLDVLLSSDTVTALDVVDALVLQVKLKRDRNPMELITDRKTISGIVHQWLNLNSGAQFIKILEYNGIFVPSANKKELEGHKKHEVIRDYLKFKPYTKRISSYGKDFLSKINPKTGRIHATFNQLGTQSGRWSCAKPNLQQIPKQVEDDPEARYRECFIARPDHTLLTVDYNQAELRLLGAVANEPEFINAYIDGLDLHKLTASHIFGIEYDAVTKDQRSRGKSINFAIVYGSTAVGLAWNFGIPIEEGEVQLESYFAAYKYIDRFIKIAGEKIWKLQYSITPFGRKRFFEIPRLFEDGSEKYKIKQSVIRRGINTIIQGGSADILKLALVDIYYKNPFGDLLKLLLTVHDEGVWEVHNSVLEEADNFVVSTLESAEQVFLKDIPAKADSTLSRTWSK